jgi:hypothetical protein
MREFASKQAAVPNANADSVAGETIYAINLSR